MNDFTVGQIIVIVLFGVVMLFVGYMERAIKLKVDWYKVLFWVVFATLIMSCMISESSRIENRAAIRALEQKAEEFSYRLKAHTESIHYGRVNQE